MLAWQRGADGPDDDDGDGSGSDGGSAAVARAEEGRRVLTIKTAAQIREGGRLFSEEIVGRRQADATAASPAAADADDGDGEAAAG